MGFIAPYGYIKEYADNKTTLRIDEQASRIVRRIFFEVAYGISTKEVSNRLNEENILTPMQYMKMTKSRNKNYYDEWSDKIVYRIIRNHTYTGDNVIIKSVKENYKQKKRTWVKIRDREIMENTHPAIVSHELFEKANCNIKNINKKENRIKDYPGILKGIVVCGECGRMMNVTGRTRKSGNIYYYFYCTNKNKKYDKCANTKRIADSVLNNIIYDALKEKIDKFVDRKKVMDKVVENIRKKYETNKKIKNMGASIECYNNTIKNLYIQKTKNEIGVQQFLEKKDSESKKKQRLEEQLEKMIEQRELVINKEELEKKYSEFITEEKIYNFAFKDLIKKVIFKKDRSIVIEFNFGVLNDNLQMEIKDTVKNQLCIIKKWG